MLENGTKLWIFLRGIQQLSGREALFRQRRAERTEEVRNSDQTSKNIHHFGTNIGQRGRIIHIFAYSRHQISFLNRFCTYRWPLQLPEWKFGENIARKFLCFAEVETLVFLIQKKEQSAIETEKTGCTGNM